MTADETEGDELDPVKEAEMNAFFGAIARGIRSEIAKGLLRGNDTCCFTTEQYKAAYNRRLDKYLPDVSDEHRWFYITPEAHLRSIPRVVREVAPGVWAPAEGNG